MERKAVMALMAAGSYWDIRTEEQYHPAIKDGSNRAPLPDGWRVLPEEVSSSGRNLQEDYGSGFSARAYQNISTKAGATPHLAPSRSLNTAVCTSR